MSFQNWSFSESVAALVSSQFRYCFLPKNIHTLTEKRFFLKNKAPMLLNSLVERETCPIKTVKASDTIILFQLNP